MRTDISPETQPHPSMAAAPGSGAQPVSAVRHPVTSSPQLTNDPRGDGASESAWSDISAGGNVVDQHPSPEDSAPCAADQGIAGSRCQPGVPAARVALIEAITRRIGDQRLSAARAAMILRLTGHRITDLLAGTADSFTVEDLIKLLPALGLGIEVVPSR